jgi:hypothetical protein
VQNDPVNFVDPAGLFALNREYFEAMEALWELWVFGMQMDQRLLPPLFDGLELSPDGGGGDSGIGGQDVGDLADLSSNIRIIGTGDSELERHKSEVLNRLEYMARNQSCNDAFRRAGLPTPFELITNGRIVLAARPLLTNPANNSLLGISEDVRAKANKSNAPAQTIRPRFTSTGKAIIVFAADAFSGDYLDEAVPHEMIHAAGVGSYPSFGYGFTRLIGVGNDLGRYPHYRDIMTNCMLK